MTKKLFGTDGVRGVANVYPMTAEFAVKLGMACGQEICRNKRRAAIGRDTRISGEMLEAGLTAGLTAAGIDVVKLGVLPTPAVTSVTPELDVDMSFMITASHNPYQDNGIKLITAEGDKFSDEVTSRLGLPQTGLSWTAAGRVPSAKTGKRSCFIWKKPKALSNRIVR